MDREAACEAVPVPASMTDGLIGYEWAHDTVGESGGAVYRLHGKAGAPNLFLKHGKDAVAEDITDEMVRLRWLAGHLPVPAVTYFARTPDEAWLLMTAVPGETAYQILAAHPDASLAVVDALTRFLRQLHAIPVHECPFTSDHAYRLARARVRIDAGLVEEDDFDKEILPLITARHQAALKTADSTLQPDISGPHRGRTKILPRLPKPAIQGTMLTASHHQEDSARPYARSDRARCLALFDGNVPVFFAASERRDFARFLDQDALNWSYQVLERNGRVVACGGFAVEKDGATASLCWGMVDRGLQGTGLGSALTHARLGAAAATPGVTQVRLDTSQHTQGFYARFGFQVVTITQDGYGPGLDRWDMLLPL